MNIFKSIPDLTIIIFAKTALTIIAFHMNNNTNKAIAYTVSASAVALATYYMNNKENTESNMNMPNPSFIKKDDEQTELYNILKSASSKLTDESLIKITRQLDFWFNYGNLSSNDFTSLAQRLVDAAHLPLQAFNDMKVNDDSAAREIPKVPTMRYGRTELQIPIVTTGGMRCQMTWMPDNIPLLSFSKNKILSHASQPALKDMIRLSLKLGMNHFETARMYGSSEMQFAAALSEMIESGEIKRSDFILQTKIQPPGPDAKSFQKIWESSWTHFQSLQYIDLFAFHCISAKYQYDDLISEKEDTAYAFIKDLQNQGIIKHIGFSTHGDAKHVYKLVASNKFDFVNLHMHYFGSYHGEGTPDTCGSHGNRAAVEKAKELDMGLFLISPYDKGGALYKPTKTVALAVGEKMTPMSFASLYAWNNAGFHTISVGVARPSDFVECYEAAMLFKDQDRSGIVKEVNAIDERLKAIAIDKLGKEWYEKGLENIPSFYEEVSNGIGLGHILWCYNVLKAYGMYDFAKERYKNMETFGASWKNDDKMTFEEKCKKMSNGNPGRCLDETIDLDEVLKNHYDSSLAKERLVEIIEVLKKDTDATDEDIRKKYDAEIAYDLSLWEDFPGRESLSIKAVIKQIFSRNFLGPLSKTGPNSAFTAHAASLREYYRSL